MKSFIKKTLAVLLSATLLFSVVPLAAAAAETTVQESVGASSGTTGECTWTLDDNGVLTISGNGEMGDYGNLTLPWGDNITSVIINDGVTSIGGAAFCHCTGLTSVTIGDSVTSIGIDAFSGCTGLTSVTSPDNVTSIGYNAFYGCNIQSASIRIRDLKSWCERTDVYRISSYPNSGISDSRNIPVELYLNNEKVTDLVIPDDVTSISRNAFLGCTGLTSVTIPDSVTSIGGAAFRYCTGLTSVTIGDSVTRIGDYAFSGCTGLTSVTIPDSIPSIGYYAFSGCAGLTSVTIPDSVTSIDTNAFSGCTNKDLVISCVSDSVGERYAKAEAIPVIVYESIDDGSAYRLTAYPENKTDVEIPATFAGKPVTSLGKWLFKYNSKIQTVSISDSVTEIPRGAFYNCTELKTVTMGNGVKTIAESAFEKCLFLENITLSNQLETIGDEAFYDCRRLRTLDIPDSVKTIGEEAFTNCRSLTSLNIPDGVGALGSEDSVGYGMFENCKSLREITIPSSVAYIPKNAFDGCDNVTILGKQNSYAQNFAAEHHILFKMIDADECMVGDVSGDGNVDITDATIVQQFAAEVVVPTAAQKTAADTNHDGAVDITDATLIQMYAAEIIHSF